MTGEGGSGPHGDSCIVQHLFLRLQIFDGVVVKIQSIFLIE